MTTTAAPSGAGLFSGDEVRIEGRDKVSGKAQYTADVRLPHMLWAAFAVSPFAHARISRIDVEAAKRVPGVRAVLTSADIGPGKRSGRMFYDFPVLAYDKAVFVGDRVAAVAAETRAAAEEAAQLVEVEYEELPAVLDPAAALAPGAPVIHPERDSYHYAGPQLPRRPHPNTQGSATIERGAPDLEALFARAHRVFEHRFSTPRQHAGYVEPHATVVRIDDAGIVHVYTPNKQPFAVRRFMSHVLALPPERIVVECTAIGGDFGGKGFTFDEYPCYYLALATGRPVKYVMRYLEELGASSTRHRSHITLKTAVDADGTFVAHASDVLFDGGAYAAGKPGPNMVPGQTGYATVPYAVPNVRLRVESAYTNTIPGAHVRSPVDVQIFFAWEQHVDMIAAGLGLDPVELRMRNVVREGDVAVAGEAIHQPMGVAVLEAYRKDRAVGGPPGRGRGFALVCRHTGGGKTAIDVTLRPGGTIDVVAGVPDQGSGIYTGVRRIIAATMSIDPERISVRRGSTGEAKPDPGSGGSRVTHIVGQAARVAAERLRDELQRRTGLTLRDDGFFEPGGSRRTFEDGIAAALDGAPLHVVGEFDSAPYDAAHHGDFSFTGFGFEVDVDRDTGAFTVHDAVVVVDVGRIINPLAHQGQIDGGFIAGFGGATMEEMPVDDNGKVTTLSLGEYKLPTAMDVPSLRTILVPAPSSDGPYGAKMAGELTNSGVAPALANAIADAAGVRLREFPLTAERIYDALSEPSFSR